MASHPWENGFHVIGQVAKHCNELSQCGDWDRLPQSTWGCRSFLGHAFSVCQGQMKYELKFYRWCFILLHGNLLECLHEQLCVSRPPLGEVSFDTATTKKWCSISPSLKDIVFFSLCNTVCEAHCRPQRKLIQYESVCLACDYWCGNVYRHCKVKHFINKLIYPNCLSDDRGSLSNSFSVRPYTGCNSFSRFPSCF